MLYDRGLATDKDREDIKNIAFRRSGCISSLICEQCQHLISDSICLCVGVFTCPNCGFKNGGNMKKLIESLPPATPPLFPVFC